MKAKRQTGLDLLRFIAVVIITMSHMIPNINSPVYSGLDSNYILFVDSLVKVLGQIANSIFIIVSTYFLLSSKSVKIKNIFFIIINSYFFLFLGFGILKLTNYLAQTNIGWFPFSWFRFAFPILTSTQWFILPYLITYILHPLLNKIVNNYEKKDGIIIVFIVVVFFLARNFIMVYTDFNIYGDNLLLFIFSYLVIGYAIKFHINFSRKMITPIIIVSLLFIFGMSYLTKYVIDPSKVDRIGYYTTSFSFLPVLLIGYSLFCVFKNLEVKNRYLCKIGENSLVGYLFINSGYIIAVGSYFIYERLCEVYFKPQYVIIYWFFSSIIYFAVLSIFVILYDISLKRFFKFCSLKIETGILYLYNRCFHNKNIHS